MSASQRAMRSRIVGAWNFSSAFFQRTMALSHRPLPNAESPLTAISRASARASIAGGACGDEALAGGGAGGADAAALPGGGAPLRASADVCASAESESAERVVVDARAATIASRIRSRAEEAGTAK